MTVKGFFILSIALAFGMMVLSAFSTIMAYLLAFVLVGLLLAGVVAFLTRKSPM